MKTIFDTLDLPGFRDRPALYIGKRELSVLKTWIDGYMTACEDAGEEKRLETPNGLSISLLRDYIACVEQDQSTGGIDKILLDASGGHEMPAWMKFFEHLDAFEALCVQSVQTMEITDALAKCAEEKRLIFTLDADGKWAPYPFHGLTFRKAVLNEELCLITQERSGGAQERPFFGNGVSVMTQKEVDEQLALYFGEVGWRDA